MPIIDLRTTPDLDRLTASVCVIGSGAAGGIVANQLALEGTDVLIIEAGSLSYDSSRPDSIEAIHLPTQCGQNLRFTEQLGGSSNRWGGRLAPLDDIDLEQRAWVPFSGWPLGMDELLPFYRRSAELLGVSHADWIPRHRSAVLSDELEAKCYQWARSRFNTRTPLLETALRPGSTLRILLNAPGQRLVADTDRSRVLYVEAAAPDGRRIKISADVFVLAAGAIQTTRLLLNSRQNGSPGLGDTYGNVGRYFMTHPRTDIGAVIFRKPIPTAHPLFRTHHLATGQFRYCIGFSGSAQASHKLLNHHLQLLPFLEHKLVRLFERVKRNKATHTRLFDRRSHLRGILPNIALASYRLMERGTSAQRIGRTFMLRGFLDQYPDPENRVCLSDATDQMGERQAAIHWRFSQRDRESVLAFLDKLSREFTERDLGKVDYDALKHSSDWPMLGLHSHFMGTTRMGSSPTEAVTDKDGRLFETSNLYVAGPSVFPTSSAVNPFLTIAALSLRLADHVKSQLMMKSKISSSYEMSHQ